MMAEALALATRGWGQVSPNPLVGAVVAQGEKVLGRGFHARYGAAHAEAEALAEAGPRARGATMYVTLEPCAHRGKTAPCTAAIIEAGIARVVIGCSDPNPLAAGGADALRGAGVEVHSTHLSEEAIRLNAPFLWGHLRSSPWTELKLALSADERISARPGERTRITGQEACNAVHDLRAGFDAILVGSETALVDDPLLTIRGAVRPRRPPVRVVVDGRLRLPLGSRLVATASSIPTWVVTDSKSDPERRDALAAAGVRILPIPDHGADRRARSIIRLLWSEGIRSLLIEGGARVAAGFLGDGLVHRIHLFQASGILGQDGVAAFPAGMGPGPWREMRREAYGDDTLRVMDHVPTLTTLIEGS